MTNSTPQKPDWQVRIEKQKTKWGKNVQSCLSILKNDNYKDIERHFAGLFSSAMEEVSEGFAQEIEKAEQRVREEERKKAREDMANIFWEVEKLNLSTNNSDMNLMETIEYVRKQCFSVKKIIEPYIVLSTPKD